MSDVPETLEQWEERIAKAKARGEHFQRLHAEGVIEHEVRKAAEQAGAFNPEQILRFLAPHARLVEVDGTHLVRVAAINDDGKEVLHTVPEAIGHMKQKKGNENLFVKPAPVQPAVPAGPPKLDFKNMSHEQYLKIRAEHPEWLGLDPSRNRRR